MQIVTWKGAGVGSLVNPFILHTEADFNKLEPFSIYLENNYSAERQDFNFFKFTDSNTVYELGLFIQSNGTTVIKTKHVLEKTLFYTNLVGAIDGPYVLADWLNKNYLLKQQVFSHYEVRFEEELKNIPIFSIGPKAPTDVHPVHFWFDTDEDFETEETTIVDLEESSYIDPYNM